MARLKIHTLGSKVLQQKAEQVTEFDGELSELAGKMMQIMVQGNGVGLAAPQVGKSIRLIVVAFLVEGALIEGEERFSCIVNPRLTLGGETRVREEGCLCLPGIEGEVERYSLCELYGQNLTGEEIQVSFSDLSARILQHEVDHLDGILFIDRISLTSRALLYKKLRQLRRKRSEED